MDNAQFFSFKPIAQVIWPSLYGSEWKIQRDILASVTPKADPKIKVRVQVVYLENSCGGLGKLDMEGKEASSESQILEGILTSLEWSCVTMWEGSPWFSSPVSAFTGGDTVVRRGKQFYTW